MSSCQKNNNLSLGPDRSLFFLGSFSLRRPYLPLQIPPKLADKEGGNVSWKDSEVLFVLHRLHDKKDSHQSGNGWKPTVWPEIDTAVQAIDPEARPAKDQAKVILKLNDSYLRCPRALKIKTTGLSWTKEKHPGSYNQLSDSF
ncbi:hypothetical protein B0H17DRAFT_1148446 [Mycena rosella]|uniref:Uncharacterized protein n=1 Tax=Mycena rosella TaxID=1033263 RepID=A0AAD7CCX4_MYCRO|nr:hypothetical protein B0H17DRAFT_1148446 [Mycena rosella]